MASLYRNYISRRRERRSVKGTSSQYNVAGQLRGQHNLGQPRIQQEILNIIALLPPQQNVGGSQLIQQLFAGSDF